MLIRLFSKVRLLSGLFVLFMSAGAMAQSVACPDTDATALSWLDKMSRSIHQVSYHGVVTLQRGDDMQVMQVSHVVNDGNSEESLTQLTGQGAQIKRGLHPLECIHPGNTLLRVGEELKAGHCGIAQHYRFSVADGERIAGRRSVRIHIQPRDMYRYGYVMSLDRVTGLLLKTEMIGRGDKVLEKFQFANLTYSAQSPGTTEVDVIHEAQHPHPFTPSINPSLGREWAVAWLPRGFSATDSPSAKSSRRTYTDGLAVFSVFLEGLEREIKPGEGQVRNGGTTSYTRGMRLTDQSVLVTVIGEVPINTARMVADSVSWLD